MDLRDKIVKQIEALEYQLTQDTNPKDKIIHLTALETLKNVLEENE